MSLQATTGGNEDFNEIRGQLQNLRSLKLINFQVVIKDERAVSVFDDPAFARKMVKKEQKRGNKNISFVQKLNGAVEIYPNMNKEEITKKILKSLQSSGANITKKERKR